VWGISCQELSAEWAAERLRGVSVSAILRQAMRRGAPPRSMIEEFDYPRHGPGQMWQAVRDRIRNAGGEVITGACATAVRHENGRATHVEYRTGGASTTVEASHVVSTLSLQEIIPLLTPSADAPAIAASQSLRYRGFLTVCIVARQANVFPDNWIYIHDPGVRVGRIQNFKNWSPDMVPDASTTSLGLEYFCNEGDELWNSSDDALLAQASHEVETLGLVKKADVEGGVVVRVPRAYPVYDASYSHAVRSVRSTLAAIENFATCGRNGMHRYNNQDHSVLTAFASVRRLLGDTSVDPWTIGHDGKYLEEA
jgi:protoporphyrinogen oxidase